MVCVFRSKIFQWRFNEDLLNKEENVEYLQKEIKNFFEYNWNTEIEDNVVWDTFKAYLRSILISLGSREKKIKEKNAGTSR